MLRKLRIGFDLDNILNNLTETLIEVYNKDSGDNLTMEQIVTYKIDSYTKPGYKISDYLKDPAIWMRVYQYLSPRNILRYSMMIMMSE